ncbi:hypothetical protein C2G38_2171244 [Gigaspora rosea]|uniref:Uncharacterized protein n=1 Tax=Gigaspora rosea TaxID=44941 RepID=A0A397VLV7_9GLOM|nr:hypothetical protein C2G38_2171244 [Gigaspora rosea]
MPISSLGTLLSCCPNNNICSSNLMAVEANEDEEKAEEDDMSIFEDMKKKKKKKKEVTDVYLLSYCVYIYIFFNIFMRIGCVRLFYCLERKVEEKVPAESTELEQPKPKKKDENIDFADFEKQLKK